MSSRDCYCLGVPRGNLVFGPVVASGLYTVARTQWGGNGVRPLRANIDETILLVIITEQGENRNQCEEQRNVFGFPYGFARRGT